MFEAEREAFKAVIKLPRPTMVETLEMASLYAAQAVACVLVLKFSFRHFGWPAEVWAIISSILALQPGWSQSVVTSVIRIIATTVGAGVALMVSWIHFHAELQLISALVIVVFVCELLRLDTALRTACVAAIIVLTVSPDHVFTSGKDRFFATILGCLLALLVQLATDLAWAAVKPKAVPIVPMKS
jgi:uncharacterized membrane protein YgaE (UPF0421/DUF939 family)